MKKKQLLISTVFVLIISLALAACTPAVSEEPVVAEEELTEDEPVAEEPAVEEPIAEETATEALDAEEVAESKVGGIYRFAHTVGPDTLDAQRTSLLASVRVLNFIGAALVALDPDANVVPWLAKSWNISDDGLVWTFYLRDDVMFTNGEPLTAQDFVFTYRRAKDPDTASPKTEDKLGPTDIDSFVALDDYTFQITLTEPFYPLLINLADQAYMMPYSQKAFEEMGADAWATSPVSCGPYMVSDWVRGDKLVLTRNPDYNWGPQIGGMNTGFWNIETIEMLVIPEYSTILAGLEAGEIDFAGIETKDVGLLDSTGFITALEAMQQGPNPFVILNSSKPPFDDIRVRKAFNLTLNRDAFIQVLAQGNGYPQYGPMTPSQIGYWEGVEDIGYGYDLEQAKALMEEAGYTYGEDGMLLSPDGEPFEMSIYTIPTETYIKTSEIALEQFKDLGVSLTITQEDIGILLQTFFSADFEFGILGYTDLEADMMYLLFHSSGGSNISHVSDPELDEILQHTRTETDPANRQEYVNQVQKMIVEKAYMVPMYIPLNFYALNTRVKGYTWSTKLNTLFLQDAYIEE